MMSPADSVALNDGHEMPLLGLGTWELRGERAYQAVRAALEIGYRHLDTATAYRNEREVGAAIADSGVERAEVFVTTKCPAEDASRARQVLEASLEHLGTDYVDLWLVHWPPGGRADPDLWRSFAEAWRDGLARSIGVSNYSTAQIDELVAATGITPAVDQIPWAPALYDERRATELAGRGVVLEGYSPLKRSSLRDHTVVEIARAHAVSPAQVVLRWHVEHRVVVIPKSSHREHLEENFAIFGFDLDADEMRRLDALGGRRR